MTDADGRGTEPRPDDELDRAVGASAALRQLLAAACAPPTAAELKGRAQAMAGFRAARRLWPTGNKPGFEPASQSHRGHRGARFWPPSGRLSPAQLTVACTAVFALLTSTTAAATAGELPATLHETVTEFFTDPGPASDSPLPPSPSSGHPLQPHPAQPHPLQQHPPRPTPDHAGPPSAPTAGGSAPTAGRPVVTAP